MNNGAAAQTKDIEMARFILIDNNSSYIFGDSGDLDGPARDETATDFASRLDASIGEHGRSYEMVGHNPRRTETGYHVYRADIGGSEAVMLVTDGQDQQMIDDVTRDCRYEGFIRCRENV